MEKKRAVPLLVLICIGCALLFSEDEKEHPPLGFLFNTSNLFLDIESYQAGVGTKLLLQNDVALRFLIDLFYANNSNTFSGALGVTFEKHFNPGRVSPYWGGFIEAGLLSQKTEVDSDNWTKNLSFPIGLGGVLGVEFFILEFLSVFAEYTLSFNGVFVFGSSSDAGVVTKDDMDLQYSIDSGIGNDSKLGITIYLEDIITIQ